MSGRQIADWIAYSQIEPFGSQYQELLLAQVCATINNCNAFRKEGVPPASPVDYMPSYEPEPESWQTIRENLRTWKDISEDDS